MPSRLHNHDGGVAQTLLRDAELDTNPSAGLTMIFLGVMQKGSDATADPF